MSPGGVPNFNRLARAYRWLEYLSLGPLLQRVRTSFLPRMTGAHRALLLGDGDGRFAAALLRANPRVRVEAVDASPAMLAVLRRRCGSSRVTTTSADLRGFTPEARFDLVTSHFVLDCLTQAEVDALVQRVASRLAGGALWAVSEFRIPDGPLHWPARAYVRLLYLAFRLLTGLRITHLPDHAVAFQRAGFALLCEQHRLGGLLTAQIWHRVPAGTDSAR